MNCELYSFSNVSVTSPTSQLILQPFRRLTYVTAHSPILLLLHLRHSSFSNHSFASTTSQALHLIHLVSCPWSTVNKQRHKYILQLCPSPHCTCTMKGMFLSQGWARVAHCVTARWRNISHYCRPLRQYDVWFTCSEHREALTARRQHTVYTNKRLQCKDEVHSSPLNK